MTPHPGEKRLVRQASQLTLAPSLLGDQVSALLLAGAGCNQDKLHEILDGMVDDLDSLLARSGLGLASL